MSSTSDNTYGEHSQGSEQQKRAQCDDEARRVFDRVLGLRTEFPDPKALIDVAAARQLQEIGGLEEIVARRATRDAAVAEVVRCDDADRIRNRHEQAKTAQRRATQTSNLARVIDEAARVEDGPAAESEPSTEQARPKESKKKQGK